VASLVALGGLKHKRVYGVLYDAVGGAFQILYGCRRSSAPAQWALASYGAACTHPERAFESIWPGHIRRASCRNGVFSRSASGRMEPSSQSRRHGLGRPLAGMLIPRKCSQSRLIWVCFLHDAAIHPHSCSLSRIRPVVSLPLSEPVFMRIRTESQRHKRRE